MYFFSRKYNIEVSSDITWSVVLSQCKDSYCYSSEDNTQAWELVLYWDLLTCKKRVKYIFIRQFMRNLFSLGITTINAVLWSSWPGCISLQSYLYHLGTYAGNCPKARLLLVCLFILSSNENNSIEQEFSCHALEMNFSQIVQGKYSI